MHMDLPSFHTLGCVPETRQENLFKTQGKIERGAAAASCDVRVQPATVIKLLKGKIFVVILYFSLCLLNLMLLFSLDLQEGRS